MKNMILLITNFLYKVVHECTIRPITMYIEAIRALHSCKLIQVHSQFCVRRMHDADLFVSLFCIHLSMAM